MRMKAIDDRPVFAGALLEIKDANDASNHGFTDTHRMAVKKVTIDEPATSPMRVIIPNKLAWQKQVSSFIAKPHNPLYYQKTFWNRTQIVNSCSIHLTLFPV